MYKYFKPHEVEGLCPDFVQKLDRARHFARVPFIITSGFRTPEHNREVGGVENSTHTRGIAVDIACSSKDIDRVIKMVYGLGRAGIGLVEVANNHIHANDNTDPDYGLAYREQNDD